MNVFTSLCLFKDESRSGSAGLLYVYYFNSTLEGCVNYFKVLSPLVVNALRLTGGVEAHETCSFIEKMGKFYDCFNVLHSRQKGQKVTVHKVY